MTSQESRALFIESQFTPAEVEDLKEKGLYRNYVEGYISINTIYNQLKEQGI
jgi:hypothetical protein